jgi:hypothetical protein
MTQTTRFVRRRKGKRRREETNESDYYQEAKQVIGAKEQMETLKHGARSESQEDHQN